MKTVVNKLFKRLEAYLLLPPIVVGEAKKIVSDHCLIAFMEDSDLKELYKQVKGFGTNELWLNLVTQVHEKLVEYRNGTLAKFEMTQKDIDAGFYKSLVQKMKDEMAVHELSVYEFPSYGSLRVSTGYFEFDPNIRNYCEFNNLARPCTIEVKHVVKFPEKLEGPAAPPCCGYINKVKES